MAAGSCAPERRDASCSRNPPLPLRSHHAMRFDLAPERLRQISASQSLPPPVRRNSINMLDKLKRELVPAAGDKLVLKLSPPPPPLADKQACAFAHVTMRSHLQDACGVKDDVKAAPKPAVDTAKPDGDVDEIYLSSPPSHLGAEACGIKSAAAEELAAKSAAAEEDAESATEEATAEEAATKKATTEEAAAKSATEEESEEAATEESAAEESATEEAQHEAKNEKNKAPTKAEKKDCAAGVANEARPHPPCLPSSLPSASLYAVRVNSINIMAENKTAGKVGIMPADVFSAPPLGAKAACDKNDVVKGVPEAKSGAEASLDESTLKKDPAAEKDPAADKVDSDKAKAMSSAHAPSPNAVFWSKLDPPTSPNGTKEAPALKPVTEDAPAFKPVTAGGAPLPSIKEFPAEEPAPSGIADWTTPSNPRRKNGRKGASAPIVRTKSITPVGGKNRFGALLGTDGNEGILGGTGKVTGGSTPPTADSGATVDVETTTPEGSAAGRFPWSKSYNLLRLFGILALICLGAAFAHSSYSATSALLSSQRHDSPWPTSPLATVAKPFTPASPNGFCEVGGNDTSSFAAIVSSDSAPANHPGGHEDGSSWGALMEAIKEAVGEPLHLIGEPPASVKEIYEKQPAEADLETVPASRNSMERKGEPEIDLVGPVYSNRTGIIARGRDTVLPVNDTSPEMRFADAGNTPEKLVETGLGAPVSSIGEWRVNRLATASPATTKDLFLQLGRAIDPLLAEPAWPAEVRAAQISDSNSVQSDISSVSRVCADRQPRCAAPVAWHAEPHHALTDELCKTDKPPANPPVDKLSIDLPSPFHFPFMSGPSSSAPVRTQQRCQFWAALFLLLGACGGVLPSVRRSSSGRLVRCRTGARRGAWLLILAALLPLACAPSVYTSGSGESGSGEIGSGEVDIDPSPSPEPSPAPSPEPSPFPEFPEPSPEPEPSPSPEFPEPSPEPEPSPSPEFPEPSPEPEPSPSPEFPKPSPPPGAGDVEIIDSTVSGCSSGRYGGVVRAASSGAVSIIGSTVSGCSASDSGAVSIIDSDVTSCSADSVRHEGGVVYAQYSGAVSIIDSDVSDCSAYHRGGVVHAYYSESLSIAGIDFIDNRAVRGSGSVLYLSNTPSSISDASFTGNTAGDDNDGATIEAVSSPINWDCRLGSWMPRKGSFFGDFS
ncbi:hypothetical protein EMIHUDRAFT_221326, partial [Emiliania huxleyi CCMP1516]|uniref:Right handed beta helix domain-containing protein n=2 Tax=Emiliania huxleyi TaxID=2903 RepID=A0A0D3HYY7_EMIH1